MSDIVPVGTDPLVVGATGHTPRVVPARGLTKSDVESIGGALDADPVILRGAVARALELLTVAGHGAPWAELVRRAAAVADWPPERRDALRDPGAADHLPALWDLATELIEGRGRDLARIHLGEPVHPDTGEDRS